MKLPLLWTLILASANGLMFFCDDGVVNDVLLLRRFMRCDMSESGGVERARFAWKPCNSFSNSKLRDCNWPIWSMALIYLLLISINELDSLQFVLTILLVVASPYMFGDGARSACNDMDRANRLPGATFSRVCTDWLRHCRFFAGCAHFSVWINNGTSTGVTRRAFFPPFFIAAKRCGGSFVPSLNDTRARALLTIPFCGFGTFSFCLTWDRNTLVEAGTIFWDFFFSIIATNYDFVHIFNACNSAVQTELTFNIRFGCVPTYYTQQSSKYVHIIYVSIYSWHAVNL